MEHFCTKQGLWVLSPITYIKGVLNRNILRDQNEQVALLCIYGHLTIVLRHTQKIVNLSFNQDIQYIYNNILGSRGITCMVMYEYNTVLNEYWNVCNEEMVTGVNLWNRKQLSTIKKKDICSEGDSLTLLRGGSQVLEQITSKHLFFVHSSSPNSPHLFLCAVLTSHSDRPELLSLWPSHWLSDWPCGCWMCWPTKLMWHWLCRGVKHVRAFAVLLLLLLFPLLQCMLLGAGCFLCKLCCIGVHTLRLEC